MAAVAELRDPANAPLGVRKNAVSDSHGVQTANFQNLLKADCNKQEYVTVRRNERP